MFGFSNYSTKSIYYDDSSKLVVGEMKGETGRVALNNFLDETKVLFIVSRWY